MAKTPAPAVRIGARRRFFRAEVDDARGHILGLQLLQHRRRHQVLGHARGGDRAMALTWMLFFCALELERLHEADQADLGRAVVRLAEVAVQARRRGGHHDAAVVLLAHDLPDAPCGHSRVPIRWTSSTSSKSASSILAKVLSRRMPALLTRMSMRPQASIASSTMRSTPCVVGDRRAVGDRLAAQRLDLVDHRLGRRRRAAARAVDRAAQVVDHHLGPAPRELQRVLRAQAAAGAGDDGHLAVEADVRHVALPKIRVENARRFASGAFCGAEGEASSARACARRAVIGTDESLSSPGGDRLPCRNPGDAPTRGIWPSDNIPVARCRPRPAWRSATTSSTTCRRRACGWRR